MFVQSKARQPKFRHVAALAPLLVLVAASPALAGPGLLADCLKRSGAVFYDAHWCGNCRKQEKLFRGYANRLAKVACYRQGDSDNMRRQCRDADVRSFPTWVFGDGSRRSGMLPLTELARLSGCPAP